jgi:hypothetical protein
VLEDVDEIAPLLDEISFDRLEGFLRPNWNIPNFAMRFSP